MILVLTDGVGLTNKLSKEHGLKTDRVSEVFSIFFNAQIRILKKYACKARHWQIIKTTGDGLIFSVVDERSCKMACKINPWHQCLEAIADAVRDTSLAKEGIRLRSVLHHCPSVLHGADLALETKECNLFNDQTLGAIQSDIFGLEVIRLARIASLVKGPFHLLTEHFVRGLVKQHTKKKEHKDIFTVREPFVKWKQSYRGSADVKWEPIPLPYLKGFEDLTMPEHVSFEQPYHVFEASFPPPVRRN